MTVRFRIDGILQPAGPFDRDEGDAVLNIFKVLADMDITEKRKAQDGSFSAEVIRRRTAFAMRLVDFRVATSGSVAGEKMVMRLLDRSRAISDLGSSACARRCTSHQPGRAAAARHADRLRPDRSGQEHHAVRLPERDRPLPEERHHRREPGRVPHRQRHADRDQPQGRQDVRHRAAQHPAARPRRDLHRRDPRRGDGRDRLPGRPDRPHGVHHASRQRHGDGHPAGCSTSACSRSSSPARCRRSWASGWCGCCARSARWRTGPTPSCCGGRTCRRTRSRRSTARRSRRRWARTRRPASEDLREL